MASAIKRKGQLVVELLLILPVFMMMFFFIMELGNIAWQTIIVHHAAYELARIGSLSCSGDWSGSSSCTGCGTAAGEVTKMFDTSKGAKLSCSTSGNDFVATLTYSAPLFFPFSSYILSSQKGTGTRTIVATVAMPVERIDRS